MKKFLFIATAGAVCLLSACSGKKGEAGGMSDKAKKNLDNANAIAKMFESNDWSKAGDYIATDAVDHASMDGKDINGLDAIKANFDNMGKSMGNFKNEMVKSMADDDYVFQWMKETATSKVDDPMMHTKAGQTMTMSAIEVSKFNKDSKVVEHWSFIDWKQMMDMMPKPDNKMPSDTAK